MKMHMLQQQHLRHVLVDGGEADSRLALSMFLILWQSENADTRVRTVGCVVLDQRQIS